jgi:Fe-S cluster assembly iron-binding protein IscA
MCGADLDRDRCRYRPPAHGERARRCGAPRGREPETTDRTVEEAGARVFVDEDTAEFLQDKVLDAAVDARGVRFTILAQRSGARGKGEWAT